MSKQNDTKAICLSHKLITNTIQQAWSPQWRKAYAHEQSQQSVKTSSHSRVASVCLRNASAALLLAEYKPYRYRKISSELPMWLQLCLAKLTQAESIGNQNGDDENQTTDLETATSGHG